MLKCNYANVKSVKWTSQWTGLAKRVGGGATGSSCWLILVGAQHLGLGCFGATAGYGYIQQQFKKLSEAHGPMADSLPLRRCSRPFAGGANVAIVAMAARPGSLHLIIHLSVYSMYRSTGLVSVTGDQSLIRHQRLV